MQDTSAFPTPDEYPEITDLIQKCAEIAEFTTLEPLQLVEEMDLLKSAITQVYISIGRVSDPDLVLHAIRNENGHVVSVVDMSREAWIALLTMDGDNGNGSTPT